MFVPRKRGPEGRNRCDAAEKMICRKERSFNWTNRIVKCFETRLKAGLYSIEEGMAFMRKHGVCEKSETQSLRVQIPELTIPSLFTSGFLKVAGGGSDSSFSPVTEWCSTLPGSWSGRSRVST